MNEYHFNLIKLLSISEEIYQLATMVNSKMENNSDGQLEELQLLFDQRQIVIHQLAVLKEQKDFQWDEEDRNLIAKLKEYESLLQPLMNGLHQSFAAQINRISKTKQASKKYIGAYQNVATEGSFIDKRK